jgi:hypothetical protein
LVIPTALGAIGGSLSKRFLIDRKNSILRITAGLLTEWLNLSRLPPGICE